QPVLLRLATEQRGGGNGGGEGGGRVGQLAVAHPARRAAVEVRADDQAVGGLECAGPVGVEVLDGEAAAGPHLVVAEDRLLGCPDLRPGRVGHVVFIDTATTE